MAAKKWNSRRSRKLLRMYKSGQHSTGEMAEKLGVSPPTVYDRLRRIGLSTTSLPRRYKAATKFEFSKKEKEKITGWKNQGVYNTEIALKLGKTIGPINRIVQELKLPTSLCKPIAMGTRFGSLTVVEHATPRKTYKGHFESRSKAKCDCGKRVIVFNYALRSGNTKTCGCRISRRNPDSIWVRVRSNITIGARARGHGKMNLSLEQVKYICSKPCFYCGVPKSNQLKGRRGGRSTGKTVLKYTGIDQVAAGRGYSPGNVLPSCLICNRAKLDLTLNEFVRWLALFGRRITPATVCKAAKEMGTQLKLLARQDLQRSGRESAYYRLHAQICSSRTSL